jgi:hypothetical protein
LMTGIAIGGVAIGLGGTYMDVTDVYMALLFMLGGCLYYWVIRRAWMVMRFLRRSICRRSTDERSVLPDRRNYVDPGYTGPDRRSGDDRRANSRRSTVR